MNINTSNFENSPLYTYNKISFNGESFHAVYELLTDGSLKLSDESDEALNILNHYSLSELMFLNASEVEDELERLANWGLRLANKDELIGAYVAIKCNNVEVCLAADYLLNKEVTPNEHNNNI